ncbi:MAG: hypothetical protein ACLGP3_00760 [Acidobacteriota bacterium]
MNFTQMHERLRQELLRRIQRGSLTVSLLSRQTGYAPAHLSNFVHGRRQLSLEAMDRILAVQHLSASDLAPPALRSGRLTMEIDRDSIPVVSHAVALFEPFVRPSAVQSMLHLPNGSLRSIHARASHNRRTWQRFVAVRIPSADALAMDPLVLPDSVVLLDRHYNSLMPYRPAHPNVYAVRHGAHLRLRYVDFLQNRLVLRPYNIAFPVDLVEIAPGEAPNDLLAGRAVLILNEL